MRVSRQCDPPHSQRAWLLDPIRPDQTHKLVDSYQVGAALEYSRGQPDAWLTSLRWVRAEREASPSPRPAYVLTRIHAKDN